MVLEKICKKLKKDYGESADLTIRRVEIGGKAAFYAAIEGLVDK